MFGHDMKHDASKVQGWSKSFAEIMAWVAQNCSQKIVLTKDRGHVFLVGAHTHAHTQTYTHTHACACVCMCVCTTHIFMYSTSLVRRPPGVFITSPNSLAEREREQEIANRSTGHTRISISRCNFYYRNDFEILVSITEIHYNKVNNAHMSMGVVTHANERCSLLQCVAVK